ncbi:protein kinase domain-containing protein [Citrus sinensis]|uniref:Protein kinase domain-containing protein n=1 Tax=Citrus sinensis TaxID=2711 RepID=A0ACB8P6W1_CITSI|nr:protein kinase domain-containing protein [Citrus sinensis]
MEKPRNRGSTRFITRTIDKSLDAMEMDKPISYLLCKKNILGFGQLREIEVSTSKGIAYLHEECRQKIVHYDIKPESVLLDENFFPKAADFGLAKLYNREHTHITSTGRRRTPGCEAPELWMPYSVTQKCDVFSFGMLLFEVVGRRRNLEKEISEGQEWFPKWGREEV